MVKNVLKESLSQVRTCSILGEVEASQVYKGTIRGGQHRGLDITITQKLTLDILYHSIHTCHVGLKCMMCIACSALLRHILKDVRALLPILCQQ